MEREERIYEGISIKKGSRLPFIHDNSDMVELRKEVGTAPVEFHGYLSESGENVVLLSGLTMPYKRIDAMSESVQKEADVIQNAVKATTEVRAVKAVDVFAKPTGVSTQPTDKPIGISALEKLKAKRISK